MPEELPSGGPTSGGPWPVAQPGNDWFFMGKWWTIRGFLWDLWWFFMESSGNLWNLPSGNDCYSNCYWTLPYCHWVPWFILFKMVFFFFIFFCMFTRGYGRPSSDTSANWKVVATWRSQTLWSMTLKCHLIWLITYNQCKGCINYIMTSYMFIVCVYIIYIYIYIYIIHAHPIYATGNIPCFSFAPNW